MPNLAALYQTHHNGGRPFTVLVDEPGPNAAGARVRIYKTRLRKSQQWEGMEYCPVEVYNETPPQSDELLVTWEQLSHVWVARCPSLYANEAESLGNSLLLHLSPLAPPPIWSKPSASANSGANSQETTPAKDGETAPVEPVRTYQYVLISGLVCQFSTNDPILEFDSPIDNNDVPYPAALSSSEVFFLCDMLRMPRSAVKAPVLGPDDTDLKQLSPKDLQWVFMHDTLYSHPWQKRKLVAQELDGYQELIPCE